MRMETINNFNMLRARLSGRGKVRVAAVEATDDHSLWAISEAEREGWAEVTNIHRETVEESAAEAVRMVRTGEAQVIMKGIVNTDVLLKAVIRKPAGLLDEGAVLTHCSAMHIPSYHKLIFMSDPAVIPYPTLDQRRAIIRHAIRLCRTFGIETPKVALIHCTEKTSEKFPVTLDYEQLIAECREGAFGQAILGGPLDLKCAVDKESATIKGITSEVAGDADIIIMPDIEAANVFYKTLTAFTETELAVGLQGAQCPISITSRSDSSQTKFNSLAMACGQVSL